MVVRPNIPSVLVADAEPYICRVFEAKLTRDHQFRVITATTGAEGLRAAEIDSFDLIIWDTRLRDSFTALARVRALCAQAAVILTTTDDRPAFAHEAVPIDAAEVLVKPFGLDLLVDRVRATLDAGAPTETSTVDFARIGQQVYVLSPGGICISRVLDRRRDEFTVVGMPRVATPSDFAPGRRVRVELRATDATYSFRSILLRECEGPVRGWELRLPRTIRREQRDSVQQPIAIPVVLEAVSHTRSGRTTGHAAVRSGDSPDARKTELISSGMTEEINTEGIGALCDRPIPIGAVITIELRYGEPPYIVGRGYVVRSERAEREAPGVDQFRMVVRFNEFSPEMRRRLRALIGERLALLRELEPATEAPRKTTE